MRYDHETETTIVDFTTDSPAQIGEEMWDGGTNAQTWQEWADNGYTKQEAANEVAEFLHSNGARYQYTDGEQFTKSRIAEYVLDYLETQ